MAKEVLEEKDITHFLKAANHLVQLPRPHIWWDYDAEADVLYLHFEAHLGSTHSEMREDGIILDYRGNRLVGITIREYLKQGHIAEIRKERGAFV